MSTMICLTGGPTNSYARKAMEAPLANLNFQQKRANNKVRNILISTIKCARKSATYKVT